MQISISLRNKKPSATTELGKQLDRKTPSIAGIIEEAWQVLNSNFNTELDQILINKSGRSMFRDHANRLCDRRNYAMHSEDANEDEPYFTRIETGMLLLDSVSYFNQLTKLIAAIEISH